VPPELAALLHGLAARLRVRRQQQALQLRQH
jgi:hypothetical protein